MTAARSSSARAQNLASDHGPDDDVILRDLRRGTTTVLAHAGAAIGCTGTIAVSGDGRVALFSGDAPGIVPKDVRDPRQCDLFVAAPLR